MGTLRVRYTNKVSRFEYARLRREEVPEAIALHMQLNGVDAVPRAGETQQMDGSGYDVVPVDPQTVIFEWVENPNTPQETVERVEAPRPTQ